ncbi:hypothetical protein D3C85_1365250 [compost metagenome]
MFIRLMLLSLPISRRWNSVLKYDRRKAPAATPRNSPLGPEMRRLKLMHQSRSPSRALNGWPISRPRLGLLRCCRKSLLSAKLAWRGMALVESATTLPVASSQRISPRTGAVTAWLKRICWRSSAGTASSSGRCTAQIRPCSERS